MPNPWIEHVKRVAKEMNVPYGCAISYAKKSYKSRQPIADTSTKSDKPAISNTTNPDKVRGVSIRRYNLMPGIRGIVRLKRRK
jgi:hypothetical protein